MKVRCWNVHVLTATLILLIAVSNECTQSQSGGNRSKIDKSTQKDSSNGKLVIISTNDETQNKKNSANKDKETKIQKGISSALKREEVVNRRLGRNLEPNLQLAKKILPVETFPKVFPGLDDPHTYADFILAVGNFPVCTPSTSSTPSTPSTSSTPSTCREELASMAFFANEARCAGKILTFKCCNTIKGCCPSLMASESFLGCRPPSFSPFTIRKFVAQKKGPWG